MSASQAPKASIRRASQLSSKDGTEASVFRASRVTVPSVASEGDYLSAAHATNSHISQKREQRAPTPAGLVVCLQESLKGLLLLEQFSLVLSAVPGPGGRNDECFSEALLPWALQGLKQYRPDSQGGRDLLALHDRTHRDLHTRQPELKFPEAAEHIAPFLLVKTDTSEFPGPGVYLRRSEMHGRAYGRLDAELTETASKLETLATSKYSDEKAVNELKGKHEQLQAEIRGLFDQLVDVWPEQVPEVLAGFGLRGITAPNVLESALNLSEQIEDALVFIFDNLVKEGDDSVPLEIPQLRRKGNIALDSYKLKGDHAARLFKNKTLLGELVGTLVETRSLVRRTWARCEDFPEIMALAPKMEQALSYPFARHRERGGRALHTLLRESDAAVRGPILALMESPLGQPVEGRGERYVLTTLDTLRPLRWVVGNYLHSSQGDEMSPYLALLRLVPQLEENYVPFLQELRGARVAGDTQEVAAIVVAKIGETRNSKDLVTRLAPVVALAELISEEALALQLKNQISNLDLLSEITKGLPTRGNLSQEVQSALGEVNSALSVSLIDYMRGDDTQALFAYIDRFRFLMEHPQLLQGRQGDEVMRSGVMIAGEFGSGKSYFVKCLASELGIPLLVVTPDESDGAPSDFMKPIKDKIAEAIKLSEQGKPCILFLDEAESLMHRRNAENILVAEKQRTNYLLQAISKLRTKHPLVMIIAATNYPEDIDGGMLRGGRFDIKVVMREPGPTVRREIIVKTMESLGAPIEFTEERLDELVDLTDGLMPLLIRRPLLEHFTFEKAQLQAQGEVFAPTYDVVKELLLEEARTTVQSWTDTLEHVRRDREKRLNEKKKQLLGE